MKVPRDPELDALFEEYGGDEDLRDFAQALRSVPQPFRTVEPTPAYRVALRRKLMREAWQQASKPVAPWYRRLLAPPALAWSGAAIGALLIAFVAVSVFTQPANTPTTVTVNSPLDHSETVAVVQPIELRFSAPMDRESVRSAVQIQPATEVGYDWQPGSTVVRLTPVNNLAPNVQYQVTVKQSARTQSGQPLTRPKVVTFVTQQPAPTQRQTPIPTPSSTPTPRVNERVVAPLGTPAPHWSSDGSLLYVVSPTGQLQAFPFAGGAPRTPNATDGVGTFAVAPDGPAYVRNGQIVYGQLTIPNVQPIALGFRGAEVAYATTRDVFQGARGAHLAALGDEAQSADFSPAGDRLAYRSTTGVLHLVDLASGRDSQVGPATGLGDWAPDGHRYAYLTDAGAVVTTADAAGGPSVPRTLADLPGVTGLAWSHSDKVLLVTSSAVYLANGDGGGRHKLQDGVYVQPEWSPAAGSFSFRRGQSAYIGQVDEPTGPAVVTTGANQDDVVTNFMNARKAQQTDKALSLLDPSGQAAFSKLNDLVFSDSSTLARYYVLLSQPGRVVVRLVLAQGGAIDQTLILQTANNNLLIHDVKETARPSFGSGPEVLRVETAPGGQVRVAFDSDLSSGTVASGVSIKGANAQTTYDSHSRTVVLTVPGGGLAPGSVYFLEVSSALQDVSLRPAHPFELAFAGPASN